MGSYMMILYASIFIFFIAGVILIYLTIGSHGYLLKKTYENDLKLIDSVFRASEEFLKEAAARRK